MKKMIKMSLVAAVAVTGLSSTVAAKPLTEAIKDVDVSGSMVYRYNDYTDDKDVNQNKDYSKNYYKIATSLKSKVNDNVTATVRVVTGKGLSDSDANLTGLSTRTSADANPTLQVNQANFTVKNDVATVIAGKQGLTTPWTIAIDSDSNEQTGTGLLALVPAGPVTVAAAYFNQTNLNNAAKKLIDGDENVATLGLMGQAGPVAIDAWYLDLQDTFDTFTIGAKANIEAITAELRYTSLDLDGANQPDNNSLIAKLSTKVGPVGLGFNYGKTDKEGGLTALDSDAKTSLTGWNVNLHDKADADMFMLHADMNVMSGLNVALNYNSIDYNNTGAAKTDATELYTQITHKMGKNLKTYVRFGKFNQEVDSKETNDAIVGRLQVEYKF